MNHAVHIEFIRCPLCEWRYDVPSLPPDVDSSTLASVFGRGIMLQHAINRRSERTEEELRKHFSTHKLEEWLTKVTALSREVEMLRLYGNKDCTAMADEALELERAAKLIR